jgi:hypothetical protein
VIIPLTIGIALVAAFAVHALRIKSEPLIDLRLFRQRSFASFGTAVLAVTLQRQASGTAAAGPTGLAAAFGHTFWWAVAFTAAAFIPVLLLPAGRLSRRQRGKPPHSLRRAPTRHCKSRRIEHRRVAVSR